MIGRTTHPNYTPEAAERRERRAAANRARLARVALLRARITAELRAERAAFTDWAAWAGVPELAPLTATVRPAGCRCGGTGVRCCEFAADR